MDLDFAKKMLEDRGLLISSRNLSMSWKKTRSHNFKYESFSHYMIKAGLVCLINKKSEMGNKQGACSEYMFPSGRKTDVLQFITKGRAMVGYEVQTSVDKKKKYPEEVPMLFIDLTKAPEKVHEALKTLEDYLKGFVV